MHQRVFLASLLTPFFNQWIIFIRQTTSLREQVSERDLLFGMSELEFSAGRFAQDLEILEFDEVVRDG